VNRFDRVHCVSSHEWAVVLSSQKQKSAHGCTCSEPRVTCAAVVRSGLFLSEPSSYFWRRRRSRGRLASPSTGTTPSTGGAPSTEAPFPFPGKPPWSSNSPRQHTPALLFFCRDARMWSAALELSAGSVCCAFGTIRRENGKDPLARRMPQPYVQNEHSKYFPILKPVGCCLSSPLPYTSSFFCQSMPRGGLSAQRNYGRVAVAASALRREHDLAPFARLDSDAALAR
jgi:hypothetical protein